MSDVSIFCDYLDAIEIRVYRFAIVIYYYISVIFRNAADVPDNIEACQ